MSNLIPFPKSHSLAAAPPEADASGFGRAITPEERAAARAYEDTLSELARKLQEETRRAISQDTKTNKNRKRTPDHSGLKLLSGKGMTE